MFVTMSSTSLGIAARILLAAGVGSTSVWGQLPQTFTAGWQPVTEAEKSLREPVVDKTSGVEAIFWHVYVQDEIFGDSVIRVLNHYVRLKIFNDKGKEDAATIEIPYGDRTSISSVAGRTIRPDGTVVELSKDAVHRKDLVRAAGTKLKAITFAMPGVEPGALLEYRWKESRDDRNLLAIRLQIQREYPVQLVKYFIKPLSQEYTTYQMGLMPFNCRPTPLKIEAHEFQSFSVQNVPAFKAEPMMPGEASVRQWVMAFYEDVTTRNPEKYWEKVGKSEYQDMKELLRATGELKKAATSAVAEAKTEEERVLSLIRHVRKNVRNLFDSTVAEADRAKVLKQRAKGRARDAGEILESGLGTADEMNTLFAAMAVQVGLQARPAFISRRSDLHFNKDYANRYLLSSLDMAVLLDGSWRVFDVSTTLLHPKMLAWFEEGAQALICDNKQPVFMATPYSEPEQSVRVKTAELELSDDGTATGMVSEIYTGHAAYIERQELEDEPESKREDTLKDRVRAVFSSAEIESVTIENALDPEKPLAYKYKVKIPGYAQRTGKRLLFQPLYFQHGATPLFSASTRKYAVEFRYGWRDEELVRLKLPAGFTLDSPENPGGLNFGPPGNYDLKMKVSPDGYLIAERVLLFGKGGRLFYPQAAYPQLKAVFDEIHRRDIVALSLRASDSGSSK